MKVFYNFCEDRVVAFAEDGTRVEFPCITSGTAFHPAAVETTLRFLCALNATDKSMMLELLHGKN